jgi:hypothetical protein
MQPPRRPTSFSWVVSFSCRSFSRGAFSGGKWRNGKPIPSKPVSRPAVKRTRSPLSPFLLHPPHPVHPVNPVRNSLRLFSIPRRLPATRKNRALGARSFAGRGKIYFSSASAFLAAFFFGAGGT